MCLQLLYMSSIYEGNMNAHLIMMEHTEMGHFPLQLEKN